MNSFKTSDYQRPQCRQFLFLDLYFNYGITPKDFGHFCRSYDKVEWKVRWSIATIQLSVNVSKTTKIPVPLLDILASLTHLFVCFTTSHALEWWHGMAKNMRQAIIITNSVQVTWYRQIKLYCRLYIYISEHINVLWPSLQPLGT